MNQAEALYVPGRSRLKSLAPGAGIAVLMTMVLGLGPVWIVSDGSLKTMGAVVLLFIPLCLVLAAAKSRAMSATRTTFTLALLVWWFLLISDKFFDRISDVQNTFEGQYSVDAYGEVAVWVIAFVVVAMISIARPGYLGKLFSGSFKWLSLFVLSCLLAATYSPSPAYSLGWGFKLFLVVLVIGLCTHCMEKLTDVRAFLGHHVGSAVHLHSGSGGGRSRSHDDVPRSGRPFQRRSCRVIRNRRLSAAYNADLEFPAGTAVAENDQCAQRADHGLFLW